MMFSFEQQLMTGKKELGC